MADTQVLGTCVFGRAGSSPASRTHVMTPDIEDICLQTYQTYLFSLGSALSLALVVLPLIECEISEQLTRGCDDSDLFFMDQHPYCRP